MEGLRQGDETGTVFLGKLDPDQFPVAACLAADFNGQIQAQAADKGEGDPRRVQPRGRQDGLDLVAEKTRQPILLTS